MLTFLLFLTGAVAISFAAALYASRFLSRIFIDRAFMAVLGAVVLTLVALTIYWFVANALIRVPSRSAEMAGLALLLEIISYTIAIAAIIPCLILGIVKGLKRSERPTD